MAYSSTHLNGNLLCGIDLETSGLRAGYHDILQICVLPITPDLKPSKEFPYFLYKLQPKRPENADIEANTVNRHLLADAINNGMEAWLAVDRFSEWFYGLKLPIGKKIVPLGHNYPFDRGFLLDWFGGQLSYDEFFRHDYRDTMSSALFINDQCDWHSERIPFPKVKLTYLCSCLEIEHPNAHDAMADAIATIEVYRRLMRYKDYIKI